MAMETRASQKFGTCIHILSLAYNMHNRLNGSCVSCNTYVHSLVMGEASFVCVYLDFALDFTSFLSGKHLNVTGNLQSKVQYIEG